MNEYLFTKDENWLLKWDKFVYENPMGSHLIYSDWLKSYESYGFDYEVGLLIENHEIKGGYGVIIPKFLFFKFYFIPHGPIFKDGKINNDIISSITKRAKLLGCCYTQFSLPVSTNNLITQFTFQPENINFAELNIKSGKLFKHLYSSYGLNWLDLKSFSNQSELLAKLQTHAKRNIKKAYKNDFKLSEARCLDTIKEAYSLIELNSEISGYSVRDYDDIKETLTRLINNGNGIFLTAWKNNKIKGSAFLIRSQHILTYIFGGTLKETPDLRVGYFLHFEAIKLAKNSNLLGYNISMGGSEGVLRFKSQFGTSKIHFESPHYYIIHNRSVFSIFNFFEKKLRGSKRRVSKMLSKIK